MRPHKTIPPLYLSLPVAALSLVSCGTHEVYPDSNGKYTGKGASYYLPQTVIVASVPIVKKEVTPGEFSAYAEALFFQPVKVTAKGASFEVGDEITLDAVGERDPSKRYTSIFTKGISKSATQVYNWNDQGVLTTGKATVENKTAEFVVSSVEAIGKIASSAGAFSGERAGKPYPNVKGLTKLRIHLDGLDKKAPKLENDLALRIGLGGALQQVPASSVANAFENATDEEKKELENARLRWNTFQEKNYTAYSEMRRAWKLYEQLVLAMKEKNAAATADIRKDIQAEIDAGMAKFYGKATTTSSTAQFRWLPDSRDPQGAPGSLVTCKVLFYLDPKYGASFVTQPEKSLDRDKTEFPRPSESASSSGGQTIKIVSKATVPSGQDKWEAAAATSKKQGWYYCIPADSLITVEVDHSIKTSKRQGIAQQGLVGFLPSTGGGAKVVSDIELDPVTGGLKTLTQGTVNFDPGLIGKAATAGSSYLDAKRADDKASDAAGDPLVKLRREKEELELRAAIKKAKEAAGE